VTGAEAERELGQRIRDYRTGRGLSLRGLAAEVGVSASLISQIETGKCRPSVSTLYAITTALGVTIDDVFGRASQPWPQQAAQPAARRPAGQHAAAPVAAGQAALAVLAAGSQLRLGPVVRPGQRELLELDSGVTWERLGHVPGVPADFILATYAPGGSSSSTGQLMRHAGIEYGLLTSGNLTLTLGFSEHELTAGDAVCFESSTPHRYRNDGETPAAGVWFVADADVG
jgi:transcriptional regulator with XRE-family HTH domain/quercetin dioxygenase-like cupin family protein